MTNPLLTCILDQIREVKLIEEEETLEMGREAATIRHLSLFFTNHFGILFFFLIALM